MHNYKSKGSQPERLQIKLNHRVLSHAHVTVNTYVAYMYVFLCVCCCCSENGLEASSRNFGESFVAFPADFLRTLPFIVIQTATEYV